MLRRLAKAFRFLLASLAIALFALPAFAAPPPSADADANLDRTTPRRAFEGFRAAASDGDYERAAKYLDLRGMSRAKAESDGPELARDLSYVIERRLTIDPSTIPDAPDAGDPKTGVTVASLYVDEEQHFITMTHVKFSDGVSRWLVAKSTVADVPELDAAYGPKPWEEKVPRMLRSPYVFGNAPWQWIGIAIALFVGMIVGRVAARAVLFVLARVVKRTQTQVDDALLVAARPPLRSIAAILTFRALLRVLALTLEVEAVFRLVTNTLLVFTVAWLMIRALTVGTRLFAAATARGQYDEEKTRGMRTQLAILHRIGSIVISVIALASVLLQFEVVRSVGTSLLASAGVAGIVLGLAAQKSLGAIIAGVQLSLAQPVRLGDTVVVDGQGGKVEELHLTYVVVKLWDERRLIVPIGKFLDQSFENWTKVGTDLRGDVMLVLDFFAPVDELRAELEKTCKSTKLWDERVCKLFVTDANERGVTVRALVSAKDADDLYDLRCFVRERLVAFVASLEQGKHLARVRTEPVSRAPS